MRLAHINFTTSDTFLSLKNRLIMQSKAAYDLGIQMDFLLVNPYRNGCVKNLEFVSFDNDGKRLKNLIKKKLFRYDLIREKIEMDHYDMAILRWAHSDFSSNSFVQKFGPKIITEHHSDEINELKNTRNNLTGKLRFLIEEKKAAYFLSRIKGLVCVTDEIRKIEMKKSGKKHTAVIPNGIDTDFVRFTRFKPFDGRIFNMIFLASHIAHRYNGLDRLIKGLINYKGKTKIFLYLVGYANDTYINLVKKVKNSNVRLQFCGLQEGNSLDEYFKKSNMAVSVLALHRKKLNEACPLKTREYIARGMPFIYSYKDVDFDGNVEFALKLPESDAAIDIEELIEFSAKTAKRPDLSEMMRSFAQSELDWKARMQKLFEFAKSLY